jgi:hypothetical protein
MLHTRFEGTTGRDRQLQIVTTHFGFMLTG